MHTDNLFQKVLVEPYEPNSTLYIVSGYASATMVSRHFRALIGNNPRSRAAFVRGQDMRIALIVGMAGRDGILKQDHDGFQELAQEYDGLFVCRYAVHGAPIHAKTFGWYRGDDTPAIGFTGSANYTQAGFISSQREVMVDHDAEEARGYFDIVMPDTIDCLDETVNDRVRIYSGRRRDEKEVEEDSASFSDSIEGLPHRRATLLTRSGGIHSAGGLNWGQRQGREPNQAYIGLRAEIYNTDFFPPIGSHFTVITDDGKTLICVRAQQRGKGIHTPDNNSLLGIYFRNRIGVSLGDAVSREDLERYGRTDVDFYKLDEETYFMDFSVSESDG